MFKNIFLAPENGGWVDSMQVEHFDPYTPGQLTKNFTATVADEISVTRGTTVKALYRDDQWIYVQVSDGRKGFVPQTYCKLLLNARNSKKEVVDKVRALY
ncbi:Protein CBG25041 [Caenorhabditis briggsae]|uniref:Protein CBG25041 n=1 Tax=Caenorhabditis briggsae TaxID=6238 RepID=H8WH01_CAEBR|nr:Protein CBG25041 [Caenorhabditis briggsae]CCG58590.1 Protein CBG25041 [Caenorhabditis briggsae]